MSTRQWRMHDLLESRGRRHRVPTIPTIYKESSVARDAFCAALTAKLIDNDRTFTTEVALWAAAAMSCASADFPLSNSMPTRERVDARLSRSPFAMTLAVPKEGFTE